MNDWRFLGFLILYGGSDSRNTSRLWEKAMRVGD